MNALKVQEVARIIRENLKKVFIGRDEIITLLLIAIFADGHVLLEDVPGLGKTLLANSIASSIDCDFKRIQFTPDLLPTDISGINYYNQKENEFVFRSGPVFTNVLLADEINRATPRTQSALLEAMQERQVTIDGVTYKLDSPFFVIATQNPIETQGTFPLPEAQLDRFFMKIGVGYPESEKAIEILSRHLDTEKSSNTLVESIKPVVRGTEIIEIKELCHKVHVSEDMKKYIVDICEQTRKHKDVLLGVSTRAAIALMKGSQAYAAVNGRDFVIPDDVKFMAMHVLPHRLVLKALSKIQANENEAVVEAIIKNVHVPTELSAEEQAN